MKSPYNKNLNHNMTLMANILREFILFWGQKFSRELMDLFSNVIVKIIIVYL